MSMCVHFQTVYIQNISSKKATMKILAEWSKMYYDVERMNCTWIFLDVIYLFNVPNEVLSLTLTLPLEMNLFTIYVSTLNNWLQWQICILFKFSSRSRTGLVLRSSLWLFLIYIFKRRNEWKKLTWFFCAAKCCMMNRSFILLLF